MQKEDGSDTCVVFIIFIIIMVKKIVMGFTLKISHNWRVLFIKNIDLTSYESNICCYFLK